MNCPTPYNSLYDSVQMELNTPSRPRPRHPKTNQICCLHGKACETGQRQADEANEKPVHLVEEDKKDTPQGGGSAREESEEQYVNLVEHEEERKIQAAAAKKDKISKTAKALADKLRDVSLSENREKKQRKKERKSEIRSPGEEDDRAKRKEEKRRKEKEEERRLEKEKEIAKERRERKEKKAADERRKGKERRRHKSRSDKRVTLDTKDAEKIKSERSYKEERRRRSDESISQTYRKVDKSPARFQQNEDESAPRKKNHKRRDGDPDRSNAKNLIPRREDPEIFESLLNLMPANEKDNTEKESSERGIAKVKYIGVCNYAAAEEQVDKRSDFRLYHQLAHRPLLDELMEELPLIVVYKTANGSYRHYPIKTRNVGSVPFYFVDHGDPKVPAHASLDLLVKYHMMNMHHHPENTSYAEPFPWWQTRRPKA